MMPTFEQLPGEPADSFAQLLVHRDSGPARLYSQTALATGSSVSTLRRRAEKWNWQKRLDVYDAEMLKTMELESTTEALRLHEKKLREFRDLQLVRARRLGQLAEQLMEFVHWSLLQHQQQGSILLGREISSVLSSSCKAVEMSMDIEAATLGVSELLGHDI